MAFHRTKAGDCKLLANAILDKDNQVAKVATTERYDPAAVATTSVVPTQPVILPGGAFQFAFCNTSNLSFIVFGAMAMTTPTTNWTNLGNAVQISPGQHQVTDVSAKNRVQKFYRVRLP